MGRTAFALLLGLAGTAFVRFAAAQAGGGATATAIVRLDSRGLTPDEDDAIDRALKRLEKRGRASVKVAPLSYSDISLMIGCPQERGGCARLMSKHLNAQRLFFVEPVREGPRGPVHARLALVRADGTVERETSREVASGAAMVAALEPLAEGFLAGTLAPVAPPPAPAAANPTVTAVATPAPASAAPRTETPSPRATEAPHPAAPPVAVASAATPTRPASRAESTHGRPHAGRTEPAPAVPVPAPVVVERPARPLAPEPPESTGRHRRPPLLRAPTYVAGLVAIGLLGAGTYFAVQFQNAQAAFDAAPCDTTAQIRVCAALLDTAQRDALFANIGFIVAGAAALGTAVLVYVDLRAHTLTDESIAISPMFGPGLAGLTVRGRFE